MGKNMKNYLHDKDTKNYIENICHQRSDLLANSASTNCRPFKVKINCSKFITNESNYSATWLC